MLQGHALGLFDDRRTWILLSHHGSSHTVLENLDILLHSEVLIADRVSQATFLLLEVYKRKSRDKLMKTVIGDWRHKRGVRLTAATVRFSRRQNLQKSILKAAMVVSRVITLVMLELSLTGGQTPSPCRKAICLPPLSNFVLQHYKYQHGGL